MEGIKLYVLGAGTLWVERGFLWHFGTREDMGKEYKPEPFAISSSQYYIDHLETKIIFDLGFKKEDFEKFPGFPMRRGIERKGKIKRLFLGGEQWTASF